MMSSAKPFGLINIGNTCYMNTVLQTLFVCEDFNRDIIGKDIEVQTLIRGYSVILKRMIKKRETTDSTKFRLSNFINLFRSHFQNVSFHQQDANEAMLHVLATFHNTLKEDFTSKLLIENINEMRYNKDIKNECATQLIKLYKDDYSIINKYFYGIFNNCVSCNNCSHVVNRVENYKGFEMSIENSDNLNDCMNEYFKQETLQDYKCNKCEQKTCTKQIELLNTPKYLIISLKRFEYSYVRNMWVKDNKKIDFPIFLHFKDFLLKNNDNKKVKNDLYKLTSVINHIGGSNNGHYYSFNYFKNNWMKCDDADVTEIKEENLVTPAAYVLVYERT